MQGWVRTARHSKGVSFLEVSDGSCFAGLQVVAAPELANFEDVRRVGTGFSVVATGELVESQGKGQSFEVQARQVEVVGDVGDDYPLQKKRHSFEFLRTIAHLRPRTNTIGAVLRVRNAASRAIHDFFQQRGFLLLHSPIITASDAEGAGELFRVSTLDAASPPKTESGDVDFEQDLLRAPGLPHRVGAARGRDRGPGDDERLHLRADLPGGELEHQPAPGRVLDGRAGDGLLRPRREHGRGPRPS